MTGTKPAVDLDGTTRSYGKDLSLADYSTLIEQAIEEGSELYVINSYNEHKKLTLNRESVPKFFEELMNEVLDSGFLTVIDSNTLLSLSVAKELLRTSDRYIREFQESGELTFETKGLLQFIPAHKLFAFKEKYDKKRNEALDEIIGMDQDLY